MSMNSAAALDASALCPVSKQSAMEEVLNAITHGLGFVGSIAGLILLSILSVIQGDALLVFGCVVYGVTLVLLYGSSTWYHACRCQNRKRFLRKADHACIYLLIAGSYTPFTLGPLAGPWGWTLFGIVWGVAFGGILLKAVAVETPDWLNSLLYLGMGWLVVVAIKPLSEALSFDALYWMFAGGLAYSLGVVFYLWNQLPYNHAVWHLFVLAGSVCHYVCVVRYVV